MLSIVLATLLIFVYKIPFIGLNSFISKVFAVVCSKVGYLENNVWVLMFLSTENPNGAMSYTFSTSGW